MNPAIYIVSHTQCFCPGSWCVSVCLSVCLSVLRPLTVHVKGMHNRQKLRLQMVWGNDAQWPVVYRSSDTPLIQTISLQTSKCSYEISKFLRFQTFGYFKWDFRISRFLIWFQFIVYLYRFQQQSARLQACCRLLRFKLEASWL